MKTPQTILVPTDFSTPVRHAVERVFRLASNASASALISRELAFQI